MKKYTILAVILVLTATVFTGCRSRRPNETVPSNETMMPTIMPTEAPTTVPSTHAATEPSTSATENPGTIPGEADTTMGNDETGSTGAANEGRTRNRSSIPNVN